MEGGGGGVIVLLEQYTGFRHIFFLFILLITFIPFCIEYIFADLYLQ